METKKAIHIIIIFISLIFVFKIGVEILNCTWLIKNLKGGDPTFSDAAFREALRTNESLIYKVAEICKYSIAYAIVVIIYTVYLVRKK